MRLVVQNVDNAEIKITTDKQTFTRRIGQGIIIYLGIGKYDTEDYQVRIDKYIKKLPKLRRLKDDQDNLSSSLLDTGGEILLVSNFTLYGTANKGIKIDFGQSSKFTEAQPVYNYFAQQLALAFPDKVQTGEFGTMMNISSTVVGPINYILDI